MAFTGNPADLWNKIHNPAAATQATITQAAAGSGIRNVCKRITASIGAAATASGPVTVVLRDGATGVGTVLFTATMSCIAQGQSVVDIDNLQIAGTANTAMTVEFTAAGAAATVESVFMQGYTQ